MEPTLRKNGLKMFDLRIKMTFGRGELVDLISNKIALGASEIPTTRGGIIKALRKAARAYGNDLVYKSEEDVIGEEEGRAALDRASRIVDRLFPELRGEAK